MGAAFLTGRWLVPKVKCKYEMSFKPAMQTSKSIRVRPLRIADFGFIRRLASRQKHFTVPPPYVLWLLRQTNSRTCMIVEHAKLGPVAYLLSILVCDRVKTLYVWQLAASKRGVRIGAVDVALIELRALVREIGIRKVLFTIDPASPSFRAIRRYAYSLFGSRLTIGKYFPSSISRNEREYIVKVV
jgi:hypothetical protein